MNYELIKVEEKLEGQISEIVLGPPPANILSSKMMDELSEQLKEDERKPHRKLIIIRGEGKHFCFGASVEEHRSDKVFEMLPRFHQFIGDLLSCQVPTLAMVSGLCLGGGFELALACTFLFADETAKFAVPEIRLAVFPPVASILLPFRCGEALSSQMILTGEQFAAKDLYRCGLINDVSEEGKLDEAVATFFKSQIQPKSASSLRMACKASRMLLRELYRKHIGKLEELYLKELMSTKDANEGIQSFLEKRKPKWQDA